MGWVVQVEKFSIVAHLLVSPNPADIWVSTNLSKEQIELYCAQNFGPVAKHILLSWRRRTFLYINAEG